MSVILFTDVVPRDQLTTQSGPSSSWAREMNHETRQFMAFQAMEEALSILIELTSAFEVGYQKRLGDITKTKQVYQPLMDQIDRMYQYHQIGEAKGNNVCALPSIHQFPTEGSGWRGFRNFYLALRKEKQRLWTYFMTKRRPADIQANCT